MAVLSAGPQPERSHAGVGQNIPLVLDKNLPVRPDKAAARGLLKHPQEFSSQRGVAQQRVGRIDKEQVEGAPGQGLLAKNREGVAAEQ